jgi:integrase
MKGSTYQYRLPSGAKRWRAQLTLGRDAAGKRQRIGESGFKRKADADDWLAQQKVKLNICCTRDDSRPLKDYLTWWLKRKEQLSPKTLERYESLAAHATRVLGEVPLSNLTAMALEDLYSDLRRKLSARTVRHVHALLHCALEAAVKYKILRFNPADGCELQPLPVDEAPSLEPDEISAFQTETDGTWVSVLVRLAACTGLRRGELLALKWSDIDESAGELRVARAIVQIKGRVIEKSTKTKRIRPVTLPPSILECLRMHREQQACIRQMFGDKYATELDLIFADYKDRPGQHLLPSSVSRACVRIGKRAGLRQSGLHLLRHSHASNLLSHLVPLPVVSKRLGHADVYTTARIYIHALPRDGRPQKSGKS